MRGPQRKHRCGLVCALRNDLRSSAGSAARLGRALEKLPGCSTRVILKPMANSCSLNEWRHRSAANRPESRLQIQRVGVSIDFQRWCERSSVSRSIAIQPPAPAVERGLLFDHDTFGLTAHHPCRGGQRVPLHFRDQQDCQFSKSYSPLCCRMGFGLQSGIGQQLSGRKLSNLHTSLHEPATHH